MVGGVLIERTVTDILPSLETNMDGIVGIIKGLSQQYEKKVGPFRKHMLFGGPMKLTPLFFSSLCD